MRNGYFGDIARDSVRSVAKPRLEGSNVPFGRRAFLYKAENTDLHGEPLKTPNGPSRAPLGGTYGTGLAQRSIKTASHMG